MDVFKVLQEKFRQQSGSGCSHGEAVFLDQNFAVVEVVLMGDNVIPPSINRHNLR